ncbi:MAG TPA: alternative ribosome rescue aminoacyl-tRNA hydrolase ArfB [Nocardioidaceae bacterium]|jgi:ribosome-associated protein|nr:aminoacyl-tRNA hydrolase [Actinomycetota bacterium]MDQ3423659.1 aminoacyl-tRNA hydrolase [Actinomycetota bacterium]HEV8055611.1 alternative ribosome rescue aminoacyl-tRNA hydrolase ArfB [Nocardioidaceae bacterium]
MRGVQVRGFVVPDAELHWRFSRSGGPGGQSVNTADSRVELSYDLAASTVFPARLRERAAAKLEGRLVRGVITISASEHRSQWRNRVAALRRLQTVLHEATAPPDAVRRPTRPSKGSQRRRLDAKRVRGGIKRMRRPPSADA